MPLTGGYDASCIPRGVEVAAYMGGVPEDIIRRQIGHFSAADPAYGQGVAKELDLKF
jgi:hypothetical protein